MHYLVCIYLLRIDNYYRAFMTHNTGLDADFFFHTQTGQFPDTGSTGAGIRHMDLLTPLLPIGVADYILKSVFTQTEITGQIITTQETELTNLKSRRGFFSRFFTRPRSYEAILSDKIQEINKLVRQISGALDDSSALVYKGGYPVRIIPDQSGAIDLGEGVGRGGNGGELGTGDLQTAGQAVLEALRGRILFNSELEKSLLEQQGKAVCNILDTLQFLALSGKVRILPSLGFTSPGEVTCFRCGNTARLGAEGIPSAGRANLFYKTSCPICKFNVICCEQCNNLGESRLCKGLFAAEENLSEREILTAARVSINRRGVPSLTPAQAEASRAIRAFVTDKTMHECLLWAVCGAGKTEIIFEAVQETLNLGGKVLYASPRRDVVIEIAPRLERAFEGVTINAVYGGSPGKFSSAGITAATAHQVIRFYKKFDLVIMDEVDAYPYKDNCMLHMAVKRAVKSQGQIIYLTATPSRELLCDVDKGKIRLVTIPARYHGFPVPEPIFIETAPFVKDGRGQTVLEPRAQDILKEWLIDRQGQVFIFLPTVKMVQIYEKVLEKAVREITGKIEPEFINFSYAQDSLRDYKRDCFRKGSSRVFVTTSIMERGITVANAHVMVLNSDFEYIFDEGTLIQMSGRAGRSAEYPHGGAVFIGRTVTGAMKGARDKISRLNSEARKLGYLNPGW